MVEMNLQLFGGRGGNSGISNSSNVVRFQQRNVDSKSNGKNLWDYRGFTQMTDKIETAVNNARTRKDVEAAYRAINDHDRNISAAIDANDSEGNTKVLYTERRRIRILKKKLLDKGIL